MWTDLLILSIWGGIVSSDTTAAFQFMISHPIVSCAVVGLLLGNFPLGFTVGLVLELVWLYEIPTGAANFSEGNVGATVAAACAILSASATGRQTPSLLLSLAVAILIAPAAGYLVGVMRRLNTKNYDRLLNLPERNFAAVRKAHLWGLLMSFVLGFVVTLVSLSFMPNVVAHVARMIPPVFDRHLVAVLPAFLGVGCGVIFFLFKDYKQWRILAAGLIIGLLYIILV